ncbi:MAG: hypothetical protein ACOVP7_04390 [Lacibacter sp.]
MKRFLQHFFLFSITAVVLLLALQFFLQKKLQNPRYYKVEQNIHTVVIGNSRPECAFNDSLISGAKNLSLVAEPYFYTYIKLRKVVESNKQIKRVVIEFSDINLSADNMHKWMYDAASVKYLYPRYANIMTLAEKKEVFSTSPVSVIKSFSFVMHDNILFSTGAGTNLLVYKQIGGFTVKEGSHIAEIKNETNKKKQVQENTFELAEFNLVYLDKIVNLCKQQQLQLFFLRSPVHPIYGINSFNKTYDSVLQYRYPAVKLLDFADYQLPDSCYFDAHHLNYLGARKVSASMDSVLKRINDSPAVHLFHHHRISIKQ